MLHEVIVESLKRTVAEAVQRNGLEDPLFSEEPLSSAAAISALPTSPTASELRSRLQADLSEEEFKILQEAAACHVSPLVMSVLRRTMGEEKFDKSMILMKMLIEQQG